MNFWDVQLSEFAGEISRITTTAHRAINREEQEREELEPIVNGEESSAGETGFWIVGGEPHTHGKGIYRKIN